MGRYITLLLFIGMMFGQEYDPETGEVVKKLYHPETGEVVIKQYDPETGELIKDQNYPDSLVSPSHPKVNSDLKNISISHLTKEQKEKYNQKRITISEYYWSIYRGQEELYLSDFFIITGYPEKAEIAKHNAQLKTGNMLRGCGWYLLCAILPVSADDIEMGIVGGLVGGLVGIAYFFYDYNEKKLEGASLKDVKIIAKKYNNDLMLRIFNEND
jgi:hypothetical protein